MTDVRDYQELTLQIYNFSANDALFILPFYIYLAKTALVIVS